MLTHSNLLHTYLGTINSKLATGNRRIQIPSIISPLLSFLEVTTALKHTNVTLIRSSVVQFYALPWANVFVFRYSRGVGLLPLSSCSSAKCSARGGWRGLPCSVWESMSLPASWMSEVLDDGFYGIFLPRSSFSFIGA